MAITAQMVKDLRAATGAGVLDSKKALEAHDGDVAKAIEHLREKGLANAVKKIGRIANEGIVTAKVSEDGTVARLVEVNCETDFVARTEDFQNLVSSVINHPELSSEIETFLQTAVNGDGRTIADTVQGTISKLGENIVVRRAVEYQLTGSGVIDAYIHPGNRIAVLVELGADNVNGDIIELAHDISLHVAALNPQFLSRDDVPAELLASERKIFMAQLDEEKKPDHIKERIVEGKVVKFFKDNTLVDQPFVKDDKLSVQEVVNQVGKKAGQTVTINRFVRFELGAN
jgi:elongation factor Ts